MIFILSLFVWGFLSSAEVAADLVSQADFDGNGEVDWPDFLAFASAFSSEETVFDLDGNGSVGFSDFLLFASVFGQKSTVGFTEDEIAYFLEIAIGAEFGNGNAVVHKWVQDLRVQVKGSPSSEDEDLFRQIMAEINELIKGVRLDLVNEDPNVEIYVVPQEEFPNYLSTYVPGNIGFFWVNFNAQQELYRSTILIDSNQSSGIRAHLIREELTQTLGLMRDSWRYSSSIFTRDGVRKLSIPKLIGPSSECCICLTCTRG